MNDNENENGHLDGKPSLPFSSSLIIHPIHSLYQDEKFCV